MAQKGINLRDLNVGDFVKVRKTGEWFNREGFITTIVWAKRGAQITVAIGIDEVVFSQKDLWVLSGAGPKPVPAQMPSILSMAEAAAMDEADIPLEDHDDEGSKASSSSAESKMTDR
jgi:hypothetical protein